MAPDEVNRTAHQSRPLYQLWRVTRREPEQTLIKESRTSQIQSFRGLGVLGFGVSGLGVYRALG